MDVPTIDVVQIVLVAKAALKVSSSKLMISFGCSQSSFGDSWRDQSEMAPLSKLRPPWAKMKENSRSVRIRIRIMSKTESSELNRLACESSSQSERYSKIHMDEKQQTGEPKHTPLYILSISSASLLVY